MSAITSANKPLNLFKIRSTPFRYAVTYVIITLCVLVLLNIYCSASIQNLFQGSKEVSLLEKCRLTASHIGELAVLNEDSIERTLSEFVTTSPTRLVVTDQSSRILYDTSNSEIGSYVLFPEILRALDGYDVFTWQYHTSATRSVAAVPYYSYGILVGSVYMIDIDQSQGILIASLQSNIFSITLALEIVLIMFSVLFSKVYSTRLRTIMSSIRTVRAGDYTHTVDVGGNDELTALGSEFNDLISRLKISEEKRSRFVSDASHELKTPLASIKLLADSILQNDMDNDTVREFVSDIGNEAERLNRMSQKLLTLSRVDAQTQTPYEITYIAPTVERVIRMLSVYAAESEVTVSAEIQNDCTILMIEDDLYQVIFNLVENAIKYNRRGGSVNISLFSSEDNAVVRVADTGMGIPKESLGYIFERFYRVDKARSRSTGGSGLGLSIVRNIVERNGGSIRVDSDIASGTVFEITFPIFDTEEN